MTNHFITKVVCLIKGYLIYKSLINRHGKKCRFFVCPFKGTGDIYLIGMLFKEYQKQNQIDTYMFTVVNNTAAAILGLYQIKNIRVLSQHESDSLVLFCEYMKRYIPNVTICIDSIPWINHASIIWKLRGLNDCNFMDMFQYTIFKMRDISTLSPPEFQNEDYHIKSFLDISNIETKKTIIIAPYSNSFPSLSMKKWGWIASELTRKGYAVCTNCAGNELPIEGTIPINIPFDCLPAVLEAAGGFIAMRSGLCDIASSANCKQVIIYPDLIWSQGTLFGYFSLKAMKLNNSAIELVSNGKYEIVKRVTELFPVLSK